MTLIDELIPPTLCELRRAVTFAQARRSGELRVDGKKPTKWPRFPLVRFSVLLLCGILFSCEDFATTQGTEGTEVLIEKGIRRVT